MASSSSARPVATAGRAVKLLAGFAAASVGAGVLVAGLALPLAVGAGSASNSTVAAFNALPTDLQQQPLSQQSKILYADGSTMATFYYENRVEVPLDQIAPVMQQAIVSIEDARFWQHGGVDPKGIARAVVSDAGGGDVQGASTLTQQWIKNVQVEKAVAALPDDATTQQRADAFAQATESSGVAGYTRKLREIKLAIAAEQKYSKKQILDDYLNIAGFGASTYGVQTASEHFFGLASKDLTIPDAALLAGMVNNPIIYDPVAHPLQALSRRNTVLDKMLAQNMITQAQHDQAVAVPLAQQLHVQPIRNGCAQAGDAGYFCDYVYRSLLQDTRLGKTVDDRRRLLLRGGLVITTTMDRAKENAADAAAKNTVPADTPVIGAAVTSVEPGTGKVLAMAQNLNYTTTTTSGPGTTNYNLNVDHGLGGPVFGLQTGSSYKPFTLADWLATGHTLNDVIDAPSVATGPQSDFTSSCTGRLVGTYHVANSEGDTTGPMTVQTATSKSINTAYMEMAKQLDLCQIRDTAAALGVHRSDGLSPKPLEVNPTSVIGTNPIAPLTMAAAYAAFADAGTYCTPYVVNSVVDAKGTTLLTGKPSCSQKLDPNVANTVTSALQQVLVNGTAAGDNIDWPAAGKTGTTNFLTGATWFVGYTKQISTAVFVGAWQKNQELSGLPVKGVSHSKVYGATFAAPLWHDYMEQAMAGLPQVGFPAPDPTMVGAATAVPQPVSDPTSTSTPGRSRHSRHSSKSTSAPSSGSAPAPSSSAPAPAPAPSSAAPSSAPKAPTPAPTGTPKK